MILLFIFNTDIITTSLFCIKIVGVLLSYGNIHRPEQEYYFIFLLIFE